MSSMRDQLSGLVYSTDKGDMCPDCREATDKCACAQNAEAARISQLDGVIRISRETSGRKGKGVSVIKGLPLSDKELKTLAKELKKLCGTGGAIKEGVVEIQGDHREKLKSFLEKRNFKVKLAGG